MRSPSTGGEPASPFFTNLSAEAGLLKPTADSYRRRSVDVGVLGVGNHRLYGATAPSRRVRNAIGPDAGDKETGVIGAGKKGGRDRMLGRYLASLLAHSLALCAAHAEEEAGEKTSQDVPPLLTGMSRPLDTIPASPLASPLDGRGSSILSEPSSVPPGFREGSASPPPSQDDFISRRPSMQFPSVSRADRIKLVGFLQSWSFDALSLTPNELLVCMGLIFESLGSMEGVDFDLDRFRALLLSLRAAYHERNGYHNFKHAADVTQACYSFLTRMGLVPPLYLLCEENFDPTRPLRKWRRNRAVEQSSVGQLLRPHDVFALMVACMGHDVGHPGLTNAYMVNARAPVAQVYDDKSILENFHTVTLIHMLRKHHFDDLLGGDFGCLGASATPFRRVLESSILATDMSRHFAFVTDLNELRKRTEAVLPRSEEQLEADRLLLCAGLIKCADISNPTRPHRISRMWAAALQAEWAVQANIEAGFGLPVTVITQDPADAKAQAKGQVGFIDLFCKPLFAAMAGVVEEFADFLDKLETGRAAWESIASQTDQAFSRPLALDFALPVKPPFRRVNTVDSASQMSEGSSETAETRSTAESAGASVESTGRASPTSTARAESKARPIPGAVESRKARPVPLRTHAPRPAHGRHVSNTSVTSISISPRSPSFFDSASSATTTFSSLSQPGAHTADSVTFLRHGSADPLSSAVLSTSAERAQRSICGGACMLGTAMCEVCAAAQRRGSLGNVIEAVVKQYEGDDDEEDEEELHLLDDAEELNLWPPHPFQ
ncbi:3',5'-cyclic-nucleotide phosphodiesterase [Rhodotorula sphaerocarpa]